MVFFSFQVSVWQGYCKKLDLNCRLRYRGVNREYIATVWIYPRQYYVYIIYKAVTDTLTDRQRKA